MEFIKDYFPLLALRVWQQIYLAGLAVFIAVIIGVPVGVLIARAKKLKDIILAVISIFQTIPSLALLALLLPILGIGIKPALVALSIYALFPIIANTVAGIQNISANIIEAAKGLGFTPWQKLRLVELPLALPFIVAGIRTATSMSIGIATLAAFIGAGGLGSFIYQGLSLNNNTLVLLGAIPAALLALILDLMIARLQYFIQSRKFRKIKYKSVLLVTLTFSLACFIALMIWPQQKQKVVVIGSKDFTEQVILSEMMAQLIEAKTSLKVIRKFNLGSTLFCHQALVQGDIDLYPEYTGTAYVLILHHKKFASPEQIYARVKEDYLKQYNLVWLNPFGFNDAQALAVRNDFANRYHLTTISDLKPYAQHLTIGVPGDFIQRPDGLIGLKKDYGLNFSAIKIMDPSLMYNAIVSKEVSAIIAFTTDARLAYYHLHLLKDDRKIFPTYYAAPVIRKNILKLHPEIARVLAPLAGLIDDKTMRELNYKVEIDKELPAQVARDFLNQHRLLK